MRNNQLVRVLRLREILQTGRHTLDGLARLMCVSTRTIRRDLEALEEAHQPMRRFTGEDGVARWTTLSSR